MSKIAPEKPKRCYIGVRVERDDYEWVWRKAIATHKDSIGGFVNKLIQKARKADKK